MSPSRIAPPDAKKIGAQVRAYLAALPPDARRAAKQLREAIRAAAPGAAEHFSYGIPGFRLEGRPLMWYAGWKEHVSVYPLTAAMKRDHAKALARHETSKGTLRLSLDEKLPIALVKKLVKTRADEIRREAVGNQ